MINFLILYKVKIEDFLDPSGVKEVEGTHQKLFVVKNNFANRVLQPRVHRRYKGRPQRRK